MQYKSLEEVITNNQKLLEEGQELQVLFEDGLAVIQSEVRDGKSELITYIEPISIRVTGSVEQFKA